MDPFDDFKMKPLTKGLGFHKKAVQLKKPIEKSEALEEVLAQTLPAPPPKEFLESQAAETSDTLEELMKSLNMPSEGFRDEDIPTAASTRRSTTPAAATNSNPSLHRTQGEIPSLRVSATLPRNQRTTVSTGEDVFLDPFPRELLSEERATPSETDQVRSQISAKSRDQRPAGARLEESIGQKTTRRRGFTPASFGLSAALLDITVGLTLALVFLLSLLTVTKVDLMAVVGNLKGDATTQMSLVLLYLAVMGMYLVVSRSFFGLTLGEWTFDYRLGSSSRQRSAWFPLLVIWRTFITLATGIVILPALSLLFQKDLARIVSGLQLYEKRY